MDCLSPGHLECPLCQPLTLPGCVSHPLELQEGIRGGRRTVPLLLPCFSGLAVACLPKLVREEKENYVWLHVSQSSSERPLLEDFV